MTMITQTQNMFPSLSNPNPLKNQTVALEANYHRICYHKDEKIH